jgi:hypothetical protein
MKRQIYLLLFLCCSILTQAQDSSPLDMVKLVFQSSPPENIKDYCTGEYKGEPNGKHINPTAVLKFRTLEQNDSTAVINMTITDSAGKTGIDTYLHCQKKGGWKIGAFRALAMTGTIEHLWSELENMSAKQVDSIIEKAKTEDPNKSSAIFHSREEYDFLLGNFKLILSLDDSIIQHFRENEPAFERLRSKALAELKTIAVNPERTTPLLKSEQKACRKLFIASVSYGDYEVCDKCISFQAGGILDNTVGYLYEPDKANLPRVTPDGVIMLREIGHGWYIYKTT